MRKREENLGGKKVNIENDEMKRIEEKKRKGKKRKKKKRKKKRNVGDEDMMV